MERPVSKTCSRCDGAKVVVTEVKLKNKTGLFDCWGHPIYEWKVSTNTQPCPVCKRRGSIVVKEKVDCTYCKGKGVL